MLLLVDCEEKTDENMNEHPEFGTFLNSMKFEVE